MKMNFRYITILSFILILSVSIFGQVDDVRKKFQDAKTRLEDEKLTLRFTNALTGGPIDEANVSIGELGEFTTDFEGKVLFPVPEDGTYITTFEKEGFITSKFNVEVKVGIILYNRHSISPKIPFGSLRVVLDWAKNPRDLDAHFVKDDGYHVSFRNMKVTSDGVARLDRDDLDGEGPETITANSIDDNGSYNYFIHDYSNRNSNDSRKLANSSASVKVFGGDNELLRVYSIPGDVIGNKWEVFKIVDGTIKD